MRTNLVFVGHVDHGKSTLIGRLLFDTNSIPDAVIQGLWEAAQKEERRVEFAYILEFGFLPGDDEFKEIL